MQILQASLATAFAVIAALQWAAPGGVGGTKVAPSSAVPLVTTPASRAVIGAAIAVHRQLGPGLLESVYQICLASELRKMEVAFDREVTLPVTYDGKRLDVGYRIDFVVEGELIVEVKCVEHLLPVHQAQLLTYLKLSGVRQGLLLNFNVQILKYGIRSVVL